ncbi:Nuc-1 negative regulatory protein preg [Penicillium cosmopolitanum]|uniref:Nuc-1 negative regulatory protein preg n=1 Tax=Penicillium cosmopolitanum TaxID=1131564 RepID=A0A9X0BEQ1_9EURO|nr:Nuc-1 negative regulatory protein preg [Penicillium cosmopolitanum]KAJ5414380.1 Nuc-1 negative regulatory protein preg [Penicillium cosmopolitanum]
MLASSPSPSTTALRSPRPQAGHYDPPAPQFNSPRSSRLAIEELRTALNRHTVDPNSPESPADRHRRRASVSTTATASASTHAYASASTSASADSSIVPSSSADTVTASDSMIPPPPPPTASSAPVSVNPPSNPSDPKVSMPAPDGSGSNKRNSQTDHHSPDGAPAGAGDPEEQVSQSKRLRPSEAEAKVLPAQYEHADPRDLVVLISSMLMELIRFNDKIPLNEGRLTRFHSRSPPRISVQDYLQRLTTHATLSPPILLAMVYYIDRLCALYPAFTVSSLTIHRFLIASATVASKGLSDSFWTNKTYARVGGIGMTELAMLELEFLFRVQWRIVPQPEVLVDYYQSLIERCDGFEIERPSGDDSSVAATTPNTNTNTNTPSA